jgi:YegS/Rv2252/BmrU family lipid kinase
MNKILYVINPAGHGGAGINVWKQVQSTWPDQINPEDVHFTSCQGHAREIAASAQGYDILAAVGGDGTVGEVMSGIMTHQVPHPRLAILPAGTGNDIARNLGISSLADAMDALHGDHVRTADLFRIDCRVDGRRAHRYAFLMVAVGFSAQPMIRPWMKRLLGPTGAYYLGTILQIIAYRAPRMTVRWEDQEYGGRILIILVGNVERTAGGSMCLAPGARFDDGELNVSIVPSRSRIKRMTTLPKIASGKHIKEPDIRYFPATEIEVDSDPPAILDIDGDLFGTTPATFAVCPNAVEVLCRNPLQTDQPRPRQTAGDGPS